MDDKNFLPRWKKKQLQSFKFQHIGDEKWFKENYYSDNNMVEAMCWRRNCPLGWFDSYVDDYLVCQNTDKYTHSNPDYRLSKDEYNDKYYTLKAFDDTPRWHVKMMCEKASVTLYYLGYDYVNYIYKIPRTKQWEKAIYYLGYGICVEGIRDIEKLIEFINEKR